MDTEQKVITVKGEEDHKVNSLIAEGWVVKKMVPVPLGVMILLERPRRKPKKDREHPSGIPKARRASRPSGTR